MVSAGPFVSILLEGSGILGQACVLETEWVLTVVHGSEACARCGLECIINLETLLEVHPVLCGLSEFVLKEEEKESVYD